MFRLTNRIKCFYISVYQSFPSDFRNNLWIGLGIFRQECSSTTRINKIDPAWQIHRIMPSLYIYLM